MPFVDLFVPNIWIYLKIAIYVSIKTQLTETMTNYFCNCYVQNFLYINNLKLSVALNIIVSYCLLYETCFYNIRLPQLISIKEVTERRTIVHFKITFLLQLLSELLFSLYVGFGWQTNINERKVKVEKRSTSLNEFSFNSAMVLQQSFLYRHIYGNLVNWRCICYYWRFLFLFDMAFWTKIVISYL